RGLRSILGGMIGVWRDVLTRKPEVLVAVESMSFLCFLMVLLMPRRPALVCWEHFNASITLGLRSRHFARKVASIFADVVIVISDEDEVLWQDLLGCSPTKIK